MEAVVQTPEQPYDLVSIVTAVMAKIVHHDAETQAKIRRAALSKKLDREQIETSATYVGNMTFGAWTGNPLI